MAWKQRKVFYGTENVTSELWLNSKLHAQDAHFSLLMVCSNYSHWQVPQTAGAADVAVLFMLGVVKVKKKIYILSCKRVYV